MNSSESTVCRLCVTGPEVLGTSIQHGLGGAVATATGIFGWNPAIFVLCAVAAVSFLCLDIQAVVFGDQMKLLYHPESSLAQRVLSKLNMERFWPTPWLCSAHLQTMFLHFFVSVPNVAYRRELLSTPDGGTIALDWAHPGEDQDGVKAGQATTPIVFLVPGLTSDSRSRYILHAVEAIVKRGWRALVVNHRGLGGVRLTSDTFYNAGWTEDLRRVILHIHETEPSAPLGAIGCSLGANILTKYLGQEGVNSPLAAAAIVGCPWDLLVCDRALHRTLRQRLYGRAMHVGLMDFAQMHKDTFRKLVDWDYAMKATSVRQFDDRITRLIGKFETTDTYYRKCSCAQFLATVCVPTLAISSLDDPICTPEAIPYDEFRENPNLILGVTKHGGHLAYLTGPTAQKIWWTDIFVNYMSAVLEAPTVTKRAREAGASKVAGIDWAPAVTLSPTSNTAAPLLPAEPTSGLNEPGGSVSELSASVEQQQQQGQASSSGLSHAPVDEQEGPASVVAHPGEVSADREPPSKDSELALGGRDLQAVELLTTDEEELGAPSDKEDGPVVRFKSRAELSGLERALLVLRARMCASEGGTRGTNGIPAPASGSPSTSLMERDPAASSEAREGSIAASASAISAAAASIAQSAATIVSLLQAPKHPEPVRIVRLPVKGVRTGRENLMHPQEAQCKTELPLPQKLTYNYVYVATLLAAAMGVPLVATAFLLNRRHKLLRS